MPLMMEAPQRVFSKGCPIIDVEILDFEDMEVKGYLYILKVYNCAMENSKSF